MKKRRIIVAVIFAMLVVTTIYCEDEMSFYTNTGDYDAWRIPLFYPDYELWETYYKPGRKFKDWTFNPKDISLCLSGDVQKIFVIDNIIVMFAEEHSSIFYKDKIYSASYILINIESKLLLEYSTKEELDKALEERGITEYTLEPIEKIFVEYRKTGICYWFPEDIKKKIIEDRLKDERKQKRR